ncbi:XdhC family protein [Parasphingorhabdus pacifica]
MTDHAPNCDAAHGAVEPAGGERVLVAVFASPVARFLLSYAEDLGFQPVLVDPRGEPAGADTFTTRVRTSMPTLDGAADVVVTDHHRTELGTVLRDALRGNPRWVGVMGNPRHPGPHVEALRSLGVDEADIDRVHRPVGLNIGSRMPAEIAIATLAGLLADRNSRPGGFHFAEPPTDSAAEHS